MKKTRFKFSLTAFIALLLTVGLLASFAIEQGSSSLVTGIVSVALIGFVLFQPIIAPNMIGKRADGMVSADLAREVWSERLETNLFKDNEFLLCSVDDSENVDYKTVHIPQSGNTPTVVKNRAKGGAATNTTVRTDQEVTYDIDEYTTDPFLITDAEEKELSYDKMDDELRDQQNELNEVVAENMLVNWAPTGTALLKDGVTTNANILRSSGIQNNDPTADLVKSLAYLPGATGNRLNYGIYDIRMAKKFLGKQNVPKAGRHVLMSEEAYDQLVTDMIATKYRDSVTIFNPETGELKKIMGFTVHVRSSVLTYTNAATPVVKAYGAATAAADNDAMLFWYEGHVSRAVGECLVYDQKGSPTHYGDVFSCLVRAGGAKRRKTEIGVLAIVQSAAA